MPLHAWPKFIVLVLPRQLAKWPACHCLSQVRCIGVVVLWSRNTATAVRSTGQHDRVLLGTKRGLMLLHVHNGTVVHEGELQPFVAHALCELSTGHVVANSWTLTPLRILSVSSSGQCQLVTTLDDVHTLWVTSICEVTDGRFVSASSDYTLRIWGIGGEWPCIGVLSGHTGAVSDAVHMSGSVIVSGGLDGTVRVWDVDRIAQADRVVNAPGKVTALVRLSPTRLAVGLHGEPTPCDILDIHNCEWAGAQCQPGSCQALIAIGGRIFGAATRAGRSQVLDACSGEVVMQVRESRRDQSTPLAFAGVGGKWVLGVNPRGDLCIRTASDPASVHTFKPSHPALALVALAVPCVRRLAAAAARASTGARKEFLQTLETASSAPGLRRVPVVLWRARRRGA